MTGLSAREARTLRALAGRQTLAEWIERPTSDTCPMPHLSDPCLVYALVTARARITDAAAPWLANVAAVKVSRG